MEDIKSYPITYNHYYTDTVKKRRREREQTSLTDCIANATIHVKLPECNSSRTSAQVDAGRAAREYCEEIDPDMENHSCEEALSSLHSIYKVHMLRVYLWLMIAYLALLSSHKKPSSTTLLRKLWSDTLCAVLRRSFLRSWSMACQTLTRRQSPLSLCQRRDRGISLKIKLGSLKMEGTFFAVL
jgi:hypothetical protein